MFFSLVLEDLWLMTGVEIVDEDDVAVDMQALAKEKSLMMHQGVASAISDSKA